MATAYADHNIGHPAMARLRALGHDVITARDLGLEHADDDEHLLVAAERGWILLTHNENDFRLLHSAWQRWSHAWGVARQHAGIVIVPQRWPKDRQIAEVDAILRSDAPAMNELRYWRPTEGWIRET